MFCAWYVSGLHCNYTIVSKICELNNHVCATWRSEIEPCRQTSSLFMLASLLSFSLTQIPPPPPHTHTRKLYSESSAFVMNEAVNRNDVQPNKLPSFAEIAVVETINKQNWPLLGKKNHCSILPWQGAAPTLIFQRQLIPQSIILSPEVRKSLINEICWQKKLSKTSRWSRGFPCGRECALHYHTWSLSRCKVTTGCPGNQAGSLLCKKTKRKKKNKAAEEQIKQK